MITEDRINDLIKTFSMFNRAKTFMQLQVYLKGENVLLNKLAELGGESSPGALVKELEMTGPRVTAILCSLEIKKLVSRKASPEDKRKTIVAITPKGQKWVDDSTSELMSSLMAMIDRLGEDDTQELIRIMNKVLGNADSKKTENEKISDNEDKTENGGENLE